MVRSASLFVLALIAGSAARAQEHPFIAAYTLTELDGGIRVGWTIQGGSTCNGQDVERSTDGVDFVQVHRIEGICGTPSAAVLYDWFDAAPPELSTVFYRIKLGLDGYSTVKSVHFAQLNTSDQRFYPSPMEGSGTLVLDLPPDQAVDLRILDSAGQLVFERLGAPGPAIPVELPAVAPGVYSYQAIGVSRKFSGRFVKN